MTVQAQQRSVPRDPFWDLVRGFAIFLVVWGHSLQFLNSQTVDYAALPAFAWIYSFHMPLFALISGYLFWGTFCRLGPGHILVRRVKQCLVPAWIWEGCLYLALNFSDLLHGRYTLPQYLFSVLQRLPYGLWFLQSIFYCSAAILFIEKCLKGHWAVYLLFCVGICWLPHTFNLDLCLSMLPYFSAGFLAHKGSIPLLKKIVAAGRWPFAPALCFLIWAGLQFGGKRLFLFPGAETLISWLSGFSGSFMVLLAVRWASRYLPAFLRNILLHLGTHSMEYYILSGYSFDVIWRVLYHFVNYTPSSLLVYQWVLTPLAAVLLLCICSVFCRVLAHLPRLYSLLFGSRAPSSVH